MRHMFKWATAVMLVTLMIGWSISSAAGEEKTAPDSQKGTISGVVTKDGHPLANAQVRLIKPMRQGEKPADARPQAAEPAPGKPGKPGKGGGVGAKPEPVATTTTDENGRFTLADVPAGAYVVAAGAKGEGVGRARVNVIAGKTVNVTIQVQVPERREGAKRAQKPAP